MTTVQNNKQTGIPVVKLRYTIPNSFTAMSLLLGVGSIVTGQLGDLELAAWMIVWCGLLDVMDGLAARLLKATSDFGAEFDSMADLVSFGVAPGILVLQAGIKYAELEVFSGAFWVLLISVGVFVLSGAMRLARFNIMSEQPVHGWFTGIPITAAGGGLTSSAVILMVRYPEIAYAMPLHAYLPVVMFVLALGMISTIRFPKAVKRDGYFINGFTALVVITTYYCGITRSYPEYLFFMGLFILVAGIIAGRVSKHKEQQGGG